MAPRDVFFWGGPWARLATAMSEFCNLPATFQDFDGQDVRYDGTSGAPIRPAARPTPHCGWPSKGGVFKFIGQPLIKGLMKGVGRSP